MDDHGMHPDKVEDGKAAFALAVFISIAVVAAAGFALLRIVL